MRPVARFIVFSAADGNSERLADQLSHVASLVGEAPGCVTWDISRQTAPDDGICVYEEWLSASCRETALGGVEGSGHGVEHLEDVLELLRHPPQVTELQPVGGARDVAGTEGVRVLSLMNADDLAPKFRLESTGEARYVRRELGARRSGLTHLKLLPGQRQGFGHWHQYVEEIYVVLAGTGRVKVDDRLLELTALDAVCVAPASVREFEAGPDGMELLAFGAHVPGDGQLAQDWWTERAEPIDPG